MEQAVKPHPTIVVMGGGTGASHLIKELRAFTPNIDAIITTYDSAGSTGRLRRDHHMPAPGDIRKATGALAESEEDAAFLEKRRADGHAIGNLMLADLFRSNGGNFEEAVNSLHRQLRGVGRVIPVCLDPTAQLIMNHHGRLLFGEHEIDTYPVSDPDAYVFTMTSQGKPAKANPTAIAALKGADAVILAPGSEYTSIAAVLAAEGIKEALKDTLLIAVTSLTLDGNSALPERHVADTIRGLERYTGRPFDAFLYNTDLDSLPNHVTPLAYSAEPFSMLPTTRAIGRPLVGQYVSTKNQYDTVVRDGLTHDAKAVSQEVAAIMNGFRSGLIAANLA